MKIYYFGCIATHGHYLFLPSGRMAHHTTTTPWGPHPDGDLVPHDASCPRLKGAHYCGGKCEQIEGEAMLHVRDGWTAISFWDRSVDQRMGSNSTVIVQGLFTFDEMMRLAREHFPEVVNRLKFQIVLKSKH